MAGLRIGELPQFELPQSDYKLHPDEKGPEALAQAAHAVAAGANHIGELYRRAFSELGNAVGGAIKGAEDASYNDAAGAAASSYADLTNNIANQGDASAGSSSPGGNVVNAGGGGTDPTAGSALFNPGEGGPLGGGGIASPGGGGLGYTAPEGSPAAPGAAPGNFDLASGGAVGGGTDANGQPTGSTVADTKISQNTIYENANKRIDDGEKQINDWVESVRTSAAGAGKRGEALVREAERKAASLRQHLYKSSMADATYLATKGTIQQLDYYVNKQSSTLHDHPDLLDTALETYDATFQHATDGIRGVKPQEQIDAAQNRGRSMMIGAALRGDAEANPQQFVSDLDAGKYDKYMDVLDQSLGIGNKAGGGMDLTSKEVFRNYGVAHQKLADEKAAAVAKQVKEQNKSQYEGGVGQIYANINGPDGKQTVTDQTFADIKKLYDMPGYTESPEKAKTLFDYAKAVRDKTLASGGVEKPGQNPKFDELNRRLSLPTTDADRASGVDVARARLNGDISPAEEKAATDYIKLRDGDAGKKIPPMQKAVSDRFDDERKAYDGAKSSQLESKYGYTPDQGKAEAARYRAWFTTQFQYKYEQAVKEGKDPMTLLDPNSPDYLPGQFKFAELRNNGEWMFAPQEPNFAPDQPHVDATGAAAKPAQSLDDIFQGKQPPAPAPAPAKPAASNEPAHTRGIVLNTGDIVNKLEDKAPGPAANKAVAGVGDPEDLVNNPPAIDFTPAPITPLPDQPGISGQGPVGEAVLAKFRQAENTPAGVVSSAGAASIYQITPVAAKDVGADYNKLTGTDPASQAYAKETAQKILTKLNGMFHGNLTDMAVAYNAGYPFAEKWINAGRPWNMLPGQTKAYLHKADFSGNVGSTTGAASGNVTFSIGNRNADLKTDPFFRQLTNDLVTTVQGAAAKSGINHLFIPGDNSGFALEGHKKAGEHPQHDALDLNLRPYSIPQRIAFIRALSQAGAKGIGVGVNGGFHVDMGHVNGKRVWGYDAAGNETSVIPEWARGVINEHLTGNYTASGPAPRQPGPEIAPPGGGKPREFTPAPADKGAEVVTPPAAEEAPAGKQNVTVPAGTPGESFMTPLLSGDKQGVEAADAHWREIIKTRGVGAVMTEFEKAKAWLGKKENAGIKKAIKWQIAHHPDIVPDDLKTYLGMIL